MGIMMGNMSTLPIGHNDIAPCSYSPHQEVLILPQKDDFKTIVSVKIYEEIHLLSLTEVNNNIMFP